MKVKGERNSMIEVKASYINAMGKTKKDYFIFTDVEVKGHGEHTGYTNNIKVCAGISACCVGVRRLIDEGQFNLEIKKGYFHCWTERKHNLKQSLDRDSVHALNTLICQLYEIYCLYPNAFKSFDLIDIKENIEDERKRIDEQQWCGSEPRKKRNIQRMGLRAISKKECD